MYGTLSRVPLPSDPPKVRLDEVGEDTHPLYTLDTTGGGEGSKEGEHGPVGVS